MLTRFSLVGLLALTGAVIVATANVATAVGQHANGAPLATFTWFPQFPSYTESIAFDASGSHDDDGEIVKYLWDFGDGNTAQGMNVKHTYEHDGNFNVTLTVVDNRDLSHAAVNAVALYDTGR